MYNKKTSALKKIRISGNLFIFVSEKIMTQLQTVEPAVQEGRTNLPTGEGGIVYAELDLTQQQQGVAPRRINEDKTEYAEILYTKPETEETADK